MSAWKYIDSENDELFKEALIEKLEIIGHNLHSLASLRVLEMDMLLHRSNYADKLEDLDDIASKLEDW